MIRHLTSPSSGAIALLLLLVVCIAPWSNLPINDDWLYAHIAKNLAENGRFAIDVPVASSVVGQAIIAWPVIHFFGFSFLTLRILTLVFSVLVLLELDLLLRFASVSASIRLIALCLLVVNPFFLHFSTSFMTEHYSYAVALFAACAWFEGRRRQNLWLGIGAAAIAGLAFWIRQLSALVFPALLIAEIIADRPQSIRIFFSRRGAAIGLWTLIVLSYVWWSASTGNVTRQSTDALTRTLSPDPLILLAELGIFGFYMTFFFVPFLIGLIGRGTTHAASFIAPVGFILTAVFALRFGDSSGAPRANLRPIFPFLHNLVTPYGVGPITLTDVYWNNSPVRPSAPRLVWIIVEVGMIALSFFWARALGAAKVKENEVGIFGISFALVTFAAVALSFQSAIFDRYHYPGMLGFTLALPTLAPLGRKSWLRIAAVIWIALLGTFSTLSLHDYFRWNEARADLVAEAQARGVNLAEIDAGYEVNGWNEVERIAATPSCGLSVFWFCGDRPFRIGVERRSSDIVLLSRSIESWLTPFPPLMLLRKR